MDQLVACPDCGTPNRVDADLCVQCWRGMNDDIASKIESAAFMPAPPPPPPSPPRTLRPAPVKTVKKAEAPAREIAPAPAPYFATAVPATAGAGAGTLGTSLPGTVEPAAKRYSGPGWRARHLALVGGLAWGLPIALSFRLAGNGSDVRGLMDASLALQIMGYIVGALAVAFLVYRVQFGDWDSVGMRWTKTSAQDSLQGFGLGLVLIGAFIGGTWMLTQEMGIDGLVRMLVGATTGPGFVLGALAVVIGAPVIEEIYFRGMLFERFGRAFGITAAVIGTTVLFVLAHGVGLWDPPRLLLGLSLGLMRRSKSLWFTMAGHAAWNLVVIALGVSMLMGPSHMFTAADGSFTLRHPPDWVNASEELPPGNDLDLVLMTPTGSFIGVGQSELAPGWNRSNVGQMLNGVQSSFPMPAGATLSPVHETNLVRGNLAKTFEMTVQVTDPTLGAGRARVVAVVRDGSTEMMTAVVACIEAECAKANADFDAMMRSLRFTQ